VPVIVEGAQAHAFVKLADQNQTTIGSHSRTQNQATTSEVTPEPWKSTFNELLKES
jgi:hypothetical protein